MYPANIWNLMATSAAGRERKIVPEYLLFILHCCQSDQNALSNMFLQ